MGHSTRSKQRLRPYKILLLLPWKKFSDGRHHHDEDGWPEQNKKLQKFMVVWCNKLDIFNNKDMVLPWTFRVRAFINSELPIYKKRLRTQKDTLQKIKEL